MIKMARRAAEPKRSARPTKRSAISRSPSTQSNPPPPPREFLTPRERAVLTQIGRGASSKEAGETLGVSARTIEFHRANIMRKLGIKKIVDLMLLALKEAEDR
jgi:DNA-binding NarL/FixJ family response regulator